jgi:hypothetical protein
MPHGRFHGHLPSQVSQQSIHVVNEAGHDSDTNDAGLVINGAHDIHPFIRLQYKLEKNHVAVGDFEIAADHGMLFSWVFRCFERICLDHIFSWRVAMRGEFTSFVHRVNSKFRLRAARLTGFVRVSSAPGSPSGYIGRIPDTNSQDIPIVTTQTITEISIPVSLTNV